MHPPHGLEIHRRHVSPKGRGGRGGMKRNKTAREGNQIQLDSTNVQRLSAMGVSSLRLHRNLVHALCVLYFRHQRKILWAGDLTNVMLQHLINRI